MISKLLSFVRAARTPARSERLIFKYFDGTKDAYADPLAVESRLVESAGPDWAGLVKVYAELGQDGLSLTPDMDRSRIAKRQATLETLLKAVRHAFQVTALKADGSGLTTAEQLMLLASYLDWVAGTREDARPLASSPGPVSASA